ncbi:AGAP006737-PA-like protein [Anopheles sinensis]|uniref:AGAP006737-PA-like protein n=1 Tax=Anopheles sinensis TaxID=74873 RepID=A0A084WLH8_ANOSI|nr:AGAP006737-PA-like protein [Anopheles sinensis]
MFCVVRVRLIVGILMVLQQTTGETAHHLSSIFRSQGYCEIVCPGKEVHTLCVRQGETERSPRSCTNFQELLGSEELWRNILNAHNGVRNRFAVLFRVANMKKLVWDDELSRMARLHLSSCERYGQDACARLTNEDVFQPDHRNVRQNVAFVVERYLPQYYAIDVIRLWYMQKDITPPARLENGPHGLQNVYQEVLNNYTLLTWAGLERVGCAAAKYRDGFQLVCNYFPFYSLAQPSAQRGPPARHCPRTFPLRSKIFDGLCTFEMDLGSGARTLVTIQTRFILFLTSKQGILTGTGKWFKSSFRGARSSMRNWIGSVSASVARVVVVARRQRNTPNSPSTSAKITEKDANT